MLPIVLSIRQNLNSIVPSVVPPIVLSVRPNMNSTVPSIVLVKDSSLLCFSIRVYQKKFISKMIS